jgi:monofunctional biosynthetic peptidoglycan transglycosylase
MWVESRTLSHALDTHGFQFISLALLPAPEQLSCKVTTETEIRPVPPPAGNRFWKFFRAVLRWSAITAVSLWLLLALLLVAYKWIDPPTTAVHVERRLQAILHGTPYKKRYQFVPLRQISPDFQHAVISAEDARFYVHHGFDWRAIQLAAQDDMEGGRIRGGSTISQQLVKNLFFGTGRSFVRKGAEFTLVPVAEFVLGKQRILELYLNVVEWGPGIYGAESACRAYYNIPARSAGRQQGAQLAAILPAPLRRKPNRMGHYSEIILKRMRQAGW